MATLNVSVTQSNVLLTSAVSSGSTLDFVINNPIPYTSYFTLETVADNNGFYTNLTSKNTSGSFTLGTGQSGLVQSDYMASVIVNPGNTTLSFIPAVNIPASTLYLRGIGAGPYSTITSFTGLLDTYPGAAAAYSVRLLSSTYAGSAIRVRRSSDNTEQNIGFNSNGNLDTASLLSFCGAGDGFVTTWYDQSGNGRNTTQTTASNQPQIVSSGSVIIQGGKPAARFDGTNDFLQYISAISYSQPNTFAIVAKINDTTVVNTFVDAGDTSDRNVIYTAANEFRMYAGGGVLSGASADLNQNLLFSEFNTTNSNFYKNNILMATGNVGTQNYKPITIGSYAAGASYINGNIQEVVFYPSNQSSNRTGINTNINTYYGIY